MGSLTQLKILTLSANQNSADFSTIQNMISFPNNWKGYIVYICDVGTTLFPPFDQANKFYANEGGQWYVAPFYEE